jgi:hypothetical protein
LARLQDLANSAYLQQGDLSSNTTKKSMEQMYIQMNNITKVDRLFILDECSIVPRGEQTFVGINFSYGDWVRDTKNTLMPIFSNGFEGRDGKYRIAITHPIINIKTGKYMGLVAASIPTIETWGKNAEEVIYGGRGNGDDYNGVCAFCNSRIDEFGYCACGGNLGVD